MSSQQSVITNIFTVSPFNEYYLPSVNRRIFEKVDSVSLFNKKFHSKFKQENTLHIIVGMDSGLLANYVMDYPLADGSKYLFVELDEVLNFLNVDIPDSINNSFSICSATQFKKILKDKDFNLFIVKHKFKLHYSTAATSNDIYTLLNHDIEKAIEHEYFESSIGFTQKIFFKRQLDNLSENLMPAKLLTNSFSGKTCIVLGGGPSLNEHLNWIRENRDKLIVFSVSRIAGKLSKEGIKSDIIVTVDPQDHSFEVNEAMMSLSDESILISADHTCAEIVAQWNGSLLYTGKQIPWDDERNNGNIKTEGPTVTNSAINIATEMGFSQILLCGIDYCHSQTGQTHTSDTYRANLGPDIGTIFEWVKTYKGEMAETPIQLLHAINDLSQFVKSHPNVTFINLSIDAAVVENVDFRVASDITLTDISTAQRDLICPQRFILNANEKKLMLNEVKVTLDVSIKKLEQLLTKLEQAKILCKKISKIKSNNNTLISMVKKLDSLENEFNNKYKKYSYIIKYYGYYEFSQFLTTKSTDSWTSDDIHNQSKVYYDVFCNVAQELYDLTLSAKARLKSRISEYAEPLNFSAFIPQWRNDRHFGRVLIWQRENSNIIENLTLDDRTTLKKLTDEYRNLFVKKDEKTNSNLIENLNNATKKLNILIHQKHLIGIKKMVEYLEPFSKQDVKIERLYYLAKSYYQFFTNSFENALETILQLSDTHREEQELSLIIRLSLKLNHIEQAIESLSKIVQYNDEYLPQYAQTLHLQGQNQLALTAYLDYLDKYPEDVPVLLKFGLFLVNVGEVDSAKSILLQVMSIDPNNQTATKYLAILNK
ncbi:6-hydroxymethylpterin diphosphokinase MptE-like protein [Shewanella metallivivens]|uniref:DUF115 domain-containing protein n=1 Tax=Shewanella metallivivens TaxID=2872342 RepID=A0ABT5TJ90_9GAMM|nr:6-hydroxymethylpterin diphosphokinase MptE-like protein [Shewanella metallivivens]MDD8058663.1 DUF115 domain-containing protein [Shewanella metallivivens]